MNSSNQEERRAQLFGWLDCFEVATRLPRINVVVVVVVVV